MSTFKGKMKEYSFLSIDRFDGDNLKSVAFLLSHCHEDHMEGIGSKSFHEHLIRSNYKLYLHEITGHLLCSDLRYAHLKDHLVMLQTGLPYSIEFDRPSCENSTVLLTLLPAGHCPGSVMFLFEGEDGVVLYTGDIRISHDDLKSMTNLFSGSQPKQIRSIYFDSTFCTRRTAHIPSRQTSRDAVIELAENWLSDDCKKKVFLYCAAKYGQEYLLCELSSALNMKVHISVAKMEIYSKIPEISRHVTSNAAETRLHACIYWVNEDDDAKKFWKDTCPDCRFYDQNVLIIKPSMMWFARKKTASKICVQDGSNMGRTYRVQYSSHSSLNEIRQILALLRPDYAYPNVVPPSSNVKEIYDLVRDLLPMPKTPTKQYDERDSDLTAGQQKSCSYGGTIQNTLGKRYSWNALSYDDSVDSKKILSSKKLSSTYRFSYNTSFSVDLQANVAAPVNEMTPLLTPKTIDLEEFEPEAVVKIGPKIVGDFTVVEAILAASQISGGTPLSVATEDIHSHRDEVSSATRRRSVSSCQDIFESCEGQCSVSDSMTAFRTQSEAGDDIKFQRSKVEPQVVCLTDESRSD